MNKYLAKLTINIILVAPTAWAHPAEKIPAGEGAAISKTSSLIRHTLMREHQPGQLMRRDAHAKHHGCVDADFEVFDSIPDEFVTGIIQPNYSYSAVIRFSNGSGKSQNDRDGDGRGLAIKLFNVPGEKILPSETSATTQDFLMINHPQFFVRNAADYVEFSEAVFGGSPAGFFFPSILPHKWRIQEMKIAKAIQNKTTQNLLGATFFSMTPYQYGDLGVVKYRARPCAASLALPGNMKSPNFLRENLKLTLDSSSACFIFEVQKQLDPLVQPVEDPTILWDEHLAPFVPVARIIIPSQMFENPGREDYCENLSMTPWHSLPEHRPLGGINRVRRVVYEEVSKLRHEINGVERVEP